MKKIFYILISMILIALPTINAPSSTTHVEFTNSFSSPYCYIPEDNNYESWWIVDNDWIDATTECMMAGGFPHESSCCPMITPDCRSDKICYTGNDTCKELSESECDGNFNIAQNDLKDIINEEVYNCNLPYDQYDESSICSWFLNCECKWEGGVCKADAEPLVFNGSKLFDEAQIIAKPSICEGSVDNSNWGECLYDITITNNCDKIDGKILRSWTAEWTGNKDCSSGCGLDQFCDTSTNKCTPEDCVPGSDEIKCSDAAKLEFFTWINVIIAVIILIIAYYLYNRKSRKKKK